MATAEALSAAHQRAIRSLRNSNGKLAHRSPYIWRSKGMSMADQLHH